MKLRLALPVLVLCLAFAAPSSHAAPWYGEHGLDLGRRDGATKPGDDFFRYANGTWLDHVVIPEDKPGYSLRLAISDTTERRVHEILDAAAARPGHVPADLEGKIGAFYRSFMDSARARSRTSSRRFAGPNRARTSPRSWAGRTRASTARSSASASTST
jgi:putative endopeptidase